MIDVAKCHFLPFKKAVFYRPIFRRAGKTPEFGGLEKRKSVFLMVNCELLIINWQILCRFEYCILSFASNWHLSRRLLVTRNSLLVTINFRHFDENLITLK
ncbi:MAG: hypothetical protein LBQ73_07445, partial [Tannerellaceae bacterium]|nr:hypothetical protein [Tannerellaceae bacterium]